VSCQLHAPCRFTPGSPLYPLHRRLDGPQSRSGDQENSWPYQDSNSDPLVGQPVVSCYTDYIIPAPKVKLFPCLNNKALCHVGVWRSRASIVNIATGYRLDDGWVGVLSPGSVKNFLFSTSSRPPLWSTQPPIQWVPGTTSPDVMWLGHEADHSPPLSAKVKKMWTYTSTPPYTFMM
jgi:hypothetical protein